MDKDIVPGLLAAIDQYFIETNANSKELKRLVELQKSGKADYKEVNELAIEIGKNMSAALKKYVNAESLPDEKFYFNIANRLINTSLKTSFDIVTGYSSDVQKSLNEQANLHLKAQLPEFNQEKAKGLVERLTAAETFDDVAWLLDEPIVTFTQAIVDDSIQKNVEFQSKVGLKPRITRTLVGKGCDWCRNLAGSYLYSEAPKEVYHRHERCRCIVNYHPGDGRKQDVWSKKWS